MTDDRRISYTAKPLPEARVHPDAKFLWLDPAAHPGADVNPTTVFAPAPEGFSFRAVEFIKTVRRPRSYPGTLTVTAFADPKFRLWVGGAYVGTGPVAAGGDYANTLPMPKQYVNRWDVPVTGEAVEVRVLVWTGCGVMTDYSTGKCGFILSAEEGDELLGVSDEDKLRDWETTGFANPNTGFRHESRLDPFLKYLATLPGETVNDRCASYARSCGVTDAEIAAWRALMLEP